MSGVLFILQKGDVGNESIQGTVAGMEKAIESSKKEETEKEKA